MVQVGFEKLFYQYQIKGFKGWVGKNTILMKKENELFWNDNVFPEGVAASYRWNLEEKIINSFQINGGHYIIRSNNKTFSEDSYFQLVQLSTSHFKDKLSLYPGFYYFNNIGNFPDKQETYTLSYSILHLGTKVDILQRPKLSAGIDYYLNLQNYNRADSIRAELKDQKNGWVLSLKLGQLNKKGDWQAHLYYAHIEKYAIVDYFAQNDWARWDYSSVNASGARLSNFQGLEFRLGYAFKQKFNLILRAYKVEELIKLGNFKETGDRIRLDMNIGF